MLKNLAFLIVLSALVLTACGAAGSPAAAPVAAPAATEASAASGPAAVDAAPANSQPITKCDWLGANFPQTTEAIQAYGASLAGVVPERVRTHVYRCTPTETVFDGLIILGPNEGYSGEFTIAVPANGAVDSYAKATYTGRHELLGAATDTMRAFDGTVTAVTATYWPWLDEAPPISGGTSSQTVAGAACIDPTALAAQHGWTYSAAPDQYGGLVVTLTGSDELPADWEANGPTGSIKEFGINRAMSATTYTIYPPYSCRAALGYSQ